MQVNNTNTNIDNTTNNEEKIQVKPTQKRYFALSSTQGSIRAFYMTNRELKVVSFDSIDAAYKAIIMSEREGYKHVVISFAPHGSAQYRTILDAVRVLRAGEDRHAFVKFVGEAESKRLRFFNALRTAMVKYFKEETLAAKVSEAIATEVTVVVEAENEDLLAKPTKRTRKPRAKK